MEYIKNIAKQKTLEAQGWTLLCNILSQANLTEEQWLAIYTALNFPVITEEATDADPSR